jgi:hypothetical protein
VQLPQSKRRKPYNYRRNRLLKLSGKASNVNIVSSSGDPGAGSYVQIRGQNTITGNTQPLYVVDGIPISSQELDNGNNTGGVNQQSRVADINPNSIESVTIRGFCLHGDSELRTELY